MNGQWIGNYQGTNSGQLVVDLDDFGSHYEGVACAYDDDQLLPDTFVQVRTLNKQETFQARLEVIPIDRDSGQPTTWKQITGLPSDNRNPHYAEVNLSWADSSLAVEWETDINTSGRALLSKTEAASPTKYRPLPDISCWKDFKAFVIGLEHRQHIFRGQSKPLRLRTSFHRTGRADLPRFLRLDVPTLHRHLSARTSHLFNLSIPEENGAFLNLIQHHGYPTPLLDWTSSPFVAAFFAFRGLKNSAVRCSADDKVRIFIFDHTAWREKFPPRNILTWRRPHFSISEFIAINNERLTPQQSVSSVTNIDDIETYIQSVETSGQHFLQIVDLPQRERPEVMRELSLMGITAGSLLPGLDGACEELRERFFDL